jgi:hypothetical protein
MSLPTYTPSAIQILSINLPSTPVSSTQSSNPERPALTPGSSPNVTRPASSSQLTPPATLLMANRQPLCNGPTSMTILAIGSDARSMGYLYGLADSIHIIRIDFTVPNSMVLDFPRDL